MDATLEIPATSVGTSVDLLREFERTGRPEPFETFMRRHASMVYATCLKVTRDPHDAEDATQATFLTLASKSRLNGEIRQPEAWLRKVAHRLSLDLIRSKKRRVNRENLRSEMTDEAAPLDSHAHADKGEVKGILNEELAKLPASYRMPLILHYFGGLSRDEMAEQLKLKPSTLGVRLHRAREQLRRKLAARGILLPTVALTALLTEVVRQGVCGHMMRSTAQQASSIALGHSAAPAMFAASTGHDSIATLLGLLSHGKLRVMLSALIVTAAISVTSGGVARFIPAAVRNWLPAFRLPSLPSFEFNAPLPSFSSKSSADTALPTAAPGMTSPGDVPMMFASARSAAAITYEPSSPAIAGLTRALAAGVLAAPSVGPTATDAVAPAAEPAADSDLVRRLAFAPVPRTSTSTAAGRSVGAPMATASRSRGASSSRAEEGDASTTHAPGHATGGDPWNNVIDPGTSFAGGGGAGGASNAADVDFQAPAGVPDRVVASVTGSVPALARSGGGRAGDARSDARSDGEPMLEGASADDRRTTRTIVFDGTSANFGGYADAERKPTELVNLGAVPDVIPIDVPPAAAVAADDYRFNYPAIPGSVLSLNGARVTLRDATEADAASVSFVDTRATRMPALPDGHQFIGVWELTATDAYESADLLVRYDDVRAARLGLSERLLKLWVSDGEGWSLMWLDPSFGRDADRNLLWVTAPGEVRFFAVSAPEPTTLTLIAGALGFVSRRRR